MGGWVISIWHGRLHFHLAAWRGDMDLFSVIGGYAWRRNITPWTDKKFVKATCTWN
jgi:hypothetical protein